MANMAYIDLFKKQNKSSRLNHQGLAVQPSPPTRVPAVSPDLMGINTGNQDYTSLAVKPDVPTGRVGLTHVPGTPNISMKTGPSITGVSASDVPFAFYGKDAMRTEGRSPEVTRGMGFLKQDYAIAQKGLPDEPRVPLSRPERELKEMQARYAIEKEAFERTGGVIDGLHPDQEELGAAVMQVRADEARAVSMREAVRQGREQVALEDLRKQYKVTKDTVLGGEQTAAQKEAGEEQAATATRTSQRTSDIVTVGGKVRRDIGRQPDVVIRDAIRIADKVNITPAKMARINKESLQIVKRLKNSYFINATPDDLAKIAKIKASDLTGVQQLKQLRDLKKRMTPQRHQKSIEKLEDITEKRRIAAERAVSEEGKEKRAKTEGQRKTNFKIEYDIIGKKIKVLKRKRAVAAEEEQPAFTTQIEDLIAEQKKLLADFKRGDARQAKVEKIESPIQQKIKKVGQSKTGSERQAKGGKGKLSREKALEYAKKYGREEARKRAVADGYEL